jgi:hypothetical protein
MNCYKFLASGAIGPISGFAWPRPSSAGPGAWVEVTGSLEACRRGVHVCRPAELSYWLHDELWETDTGGDQFDALDCLVVRRARLRRRVDAWSEGGAQRFVLSCISHAAALVGSSTEPTLRGHLDDAQRAADAGYLAVSAFSCALAVGSLDPDGETPRMFRRERTWQAAWIASELLGA